MTFGKHSTIESSDLVSIDSNNVRRLRVETAFPENANINVDLSKGLGSGIVLDAWGRQKTIADYSIMHGLFTLNIPKEMWVIQENGLETFGLTSPQAYSRNGALYMDSKSTKVELVSKRHPRYQPNRGHLYSSSMFLPSPERLGIREFGLATHDSGVFFRLRDGVLYAVARTTEDNSFLLSEEGDLLTQENGFYLITKEGGIVEDERPIDTTGIDLSKGNIYDIQMQWRGVGNFKFFINQKLVIEFGYLGTLDALSVFNPAMPIYFNCQNNGQDVVLKCGCVDISSEGGNREYRQYASITSPETTTTTTEKAVALLYIPQEVDLLTNTRDIVLSRITAWCTGDALFNIYWTRRPDAIVANLTNKDYGFQQYAFNGDIISFNKSLMNFIASYRIKANDNTSVQNPLQSGDFYLTRGDYLLVTIQAKNNTLGGCTIEYGQEI